MRWTDSSVGVSKQSLLLVDGDTRSLRVLEVSLRKAGFTVTTAVSVLDALDKLELHAPDLIISETTFSDGDGFELRRRVRATADWSEIPFIFLTAEGALENKIRGLELGVDDYLTKPIYIREIVTRINILLQKRQRTRFEERRDGRTRFAGRVADMPVVDVIQTIEISRKSGVIQFVDDRGRQAAIYFRDGRVIDAEAGALQGEDAVYRLLTWSEGEFEVVFRTVRRREVIAMSSQGLLMEGMRRLDEWSRLQEQLPPLQHRFEVDVAELALRLSDVPDDNNRILRLIDGKRTLLEVIDASDVGDLECLQAISRLYFEDLLVDLDDHGRSRRNTGRALPAVAAPAAAPVDGEIAGERGADSGRDVREPDGPLADSSPGGGRGAAAAAAAAAARIDALIAKTAPGAFEPGALMGGYRPSSLRLIEEAVAAAEAIEPSLLDDDQPAGEAAVAVARSAAQSDPAPRGGSRGGPAAGVSAAGHEPLVPRTPPQGIPVSAAGPKLSGPRLGPPAAMGSDALPLHRPGAAVGEGATLGRITTRAARSGGLAEDLSVTGPRPSTAPGLVAEPRPPARSVEADGEGGARRRGLFGEGLERPGSGAYSIVGAARRAATFAATPPPAADPFTDVDPLSRTPVGTQPIAGSGLAPDGRSSAAPALGTAPGIARLEQPAAGAAALRSPARGGASGAVASLRAEGPVAPVAAGEPADSSIGGAGGGAEVASGGAGGAGDGRGWGADVPVGSGSGAVAWGHGAGGAGMGGVGLGGAGAVGRRGAAVASAGGAAGAVGARAAGAVSASAVSAEAGGGIAGAGAGSGAGDDDEWEAPEGQVDSGRMSLERGGGAGAGRALEAAAAGGRAGDGSRGSLDDLVERERDAPLTGSSVRAADSETAPPRVDEAAATGAPRTRMPAVGEVSGEPGAGGTGSQVAGTTGSLGDAAADSPAAAADHTAVARGPEREHPEAGGTAALSESGSEAAAEDARHAATDLEARSDRAGDSGLRMIGSLGRDRAEASGELSPGGRPVAPVSEMQRELVTILPRRVTRELAAVSIEPGASGRLAAEGPAQGDGGARVDAAARHHRATRDTEPLPDARRGVRSETARVARSEDRGAPAADAGTPHAGSAAAPREARGGAGEHERAAAGAPAAGPETPIAGAGATASAPEAQAQSEDAPPARAARRSGEGRAVTSGLRGPRSPAPMGAVESPAPARAVTGSGVVRRARGPGIAAFTLIALAAALAALAVYMRLQRTPSETRARPGAPPAIAPERGAGVAGDPEVAATRPAGPESSVGVPHGGSGSGGPSVHAPGGQSPPAAGAAPAGGGPDRGARGGDPLGVPGAPESGGGSPPAAGAEPAVGGGAPRLDGTGAGAPERDGRAGTAAGSAAAVGAGGAPPLAGSAAARSDADGGAPAPAGARGAAPDRAAQAKALVEEATDAINEGAFDRALRAADGALALRKTARAHLVRARALQRLDRVQEALAACKAAELLAPQYASVYELRGRILWAARRKEEARQQFELFLELEPEGPRAAQVLRLLAEPR
jgi:CheY-like chemotaxis protein